MIYRKNRYFAQTGAGLLIVSSMVGLVSAQTAPIYSCTDAAGRKLTSDRPIAECLDREQKVLSSSGTVKAKVGPSLTAQERAVLEAREKAEQDERARLVEEKRRERALLVRYPNQTVHDKERNEALSQIRAVRQAASTRIDELLRQRAEVNEEMLFYKKDPSKAPASLRRQGDEITQSIAIQERFIAEQDAEAKRVTARFDEQLARLKQLWAQQAPPPPPAPATSKSR